VIARIFIVEDHPIFRDGLRMALSTHDSIEIVGEAATGEEAMTTLAEVCGRVDVVLLDLQLPDRTGIEVARAINQINATAPATMKMLAISMSEEDDTVVAVLRAGVLGYLAKTSSRDELLRAIHTVAAGGAVFSPSVAGRLTTYFSEVHQVPSRAAFPELTERERQVLDLIARGHTNRQIARQLVLSEKTVRNHITHTFIKLQVTDRTAAAVRARDAGLGR
jgi:DNA-binding NarL/FixJ family response regulator